MRTLSRGGKYTGNRLHGEIIRKDVHPYGAGRGGPMNLQCPNCKSTDLKKVSLAHQDGLQHVSTRTRLRASSHTNGRARWSSPTRATR